MLSWMKFLWFVINNFLGTPSEVENAIEDIPAALELTFSSSAVRVKVLKAEVLGVIPKFNGFIKGTDSNV